MNKVKKLCLMLALGATLGCTGTTEASWWKPKKDKDVSKDLVREEGYRLTLFEKIIAAIDEYLFKVSRLKDDSAKKKFTKSAKFYRKLIVAPYEKLKKSRGKTRVW